MAQSAGNALVLRPGADVQVYLYADPVDMRKSIDGLSALIEAEMTLSPFADALFVFCNRGRDKIKMLYWERNGFVVWYKRLEQQRFHWQGVSGEPLSLDGLTLNSLLNGINIWQQKPHKSVSFSSVL